MPTTGDTANLYDDKLSGYPSAVPPFRFTAPPPVWEINLDGCWMSVRGVPTIICNNEPLDRGLGLCKNHLSELLDH